MEQFFAFCLVFAVGCAGYFAFKWLRLPNPALLGSMFATGALNIFGCYPPFHTAAVSFCANAAIGFILGRQIDRNVLRRIRALAFPVFLLAGGIILLSLVCGYTLYLVTHIDLPTALISGAAGGIAEMIIFGMSIDADVAVIAFVQVFRIVIFLALIPQISLFAEKIGAKRREEEPKIAVSSLDPFTKRDYILLVLAVLAGAAVGKWLNIPTGTMLGAMIAGGVFAVAIGRTYSYDPRIRFVAQIALGLVMGQRMTPQIVAQLGSLLLPTLAVTVVMLAGSIALGFLLHRITGWNLTTCLLCAAPAGLGQITVYAEEIGADSFTASIFHTVRILSIVSLYPWIIMPLMR